MVSVPNIPATQSPQFPAKKTIEVSFPNMKNNTKVSVPNIYRNKETRRGLGLLGLIGPPQKPKVAPSLATVRSVEFCAHVGTINCNDEKSHMMA